MIYGSPEDDALEAINVDFFSGNVWVSGWSRGLLISEGYFTLAQLGVLTADGYFAEINPVTLARGISQLLYMGGAPWEDIGRGIVVDGYGIVNVAHHFFYNTDQYGTLLTENA